MKDDITLSLQKLKDAIDKLREGINIAKSDLEKDGVIQRFEFTFELLWKSAKLIFHDMGINVNSPKETFKLMYKNGMIEDENLLLEMLYDRNSMSHSYNKELSEKIFLNIKQKYVSFIEKIFDALEIKTKKFKFISI